MSVSSTALITLAEAKVFPGLSGLASDQDAIIEALIDSASLDFEAYWQNAGIQRAFTERHTWQEIIQGSRNHDTIWLQKYPLVSVTSITDPAGNTVDSDEYWLDYDVGALRTTGGWTIPQDDNGFATYWTIVYTAGRVADTASVPANIKMACKMWLSSLYKRPDRDVIAKRIGDFSVEYRGTVTGADLPDNIARMISAWKKREI